MSDEAAEVQLTLPSERTATPMETEMTKKVYQSTPMFDDPISSASEDENRASRTTVRSKMVTVPLQNSMRLPKGATSVISTSRKMSASIASTSRAGTGIYALQYGGNNRWLAEPKSHTRPHNFDYARENREAEQFQEGTLAMHPERD